MPCDYPVSVSSPRWGEEGARAWRGKVRDDFGMKKRVPAKEFSRILRRNQTETEARLWSRLRNRQLDGRKFRRQFPIGGYIADFVSIEAKLVIELDGGQHSDAVEYDAKRTAEFEASGFFVLRFWNADVARDIESVLATIHATLRPEEYGV